MTGTFATHEITFLDPGVIISVLPLGADKEIGISTALFEEDLSVSPKKPVIGDTVRLIRTAKISGVVKAASLLQETVRVEKWTRGIEFSYSHPQVQEKLAAALHMVAFEEGERRSLREGELLTVDEIDENGDPKSFILQNSEQMEKM